MKLQLDPNKLYYSISEVAEMFGVSKSLLRYWETEFSTPKPHKNSKGDRRFTKQNLEQLQLIHTLVKEKGFTLEGAKKEIFHLKQRNKSKAMIISKLEKLKRSLKKLSDEI